MRWLLGLVALSLLAAASPPTPALPDTDKFQQAINYVFTGKVDPQDPPEIIDRAACVVQLRDPKFNQYIRYHLSRFKMDEALYDKKYSGSRVLYELSVKGDDVVIEYLSPDKKTVIQAYRSAQISLPGEPDLTQRALRIVFSDYCKAEAPKTLPF